MTQTVHGLFLRSVRRHPQRIALETSQGVFMTYQELQRQGCSAARFLKSRGVGPGCVVATCVDEGYPMIVTKLAILIAGNAFDVCTRASTRFNGQQESRYHC